MRGSCGCRTGARVHQGVSDELSELRDTRRSVEKGRGSRGSAEIGRVRHCGRLQSAGSWWHACAVRAGACGRSGDVRSAEKSGNPVECPAMERTSQVDWKYVVDWRNSRNTCALFE